MRGRIWDFPSTHADFEASGGGLAKGRVQKQLGADGRMVWADGGLSGYSDKANFDQWYRDVVGLNASTPFQIELQKVEGTDRFEYSNSAFFPIDGRLLGNEDNRWTDGSGVARNFHFTTHLAGDFAFNKPEDAFTFTGDDDLWVFFDGQLGIDLGGVHSPENATITGKELIALGLEPGKMYRMDIFHAERHTDGSNFRIETNFNIQPPTNSELPPPALPADAPTRIVTSLTGATCTDQNFDLADMLSKEDA